MRPDYSFILSAQVAIDATADVLVFAPPVPVNIKRWGVIVTVALDATPGALELRGDLRPAAGSDTNRTDGTLGIIDHAVDAAQGTVLYTERSTSEWAVNPGEEMVVQVSGAATAGDGKVFIEYEVMPFVAPRVGSNVIDATGS